MCQANQKTITYGLHTISTFFKMLDELGIHTLAYDIPSHQRSEWGELTAISFCLIKVANTNSQLPILFLLL